MKKTLAILLALLAAASITLASCNDTGRTPVDDDWDDEDNDYVESDGESDESQSNGEGEGNGDGQTPGGNDDENNDTPTTPSGWVDKNDTVYAGVNFYLRSSASNATTSVLTEKPIQFGTALSRVSTNGTWDKVKVSGDDNEYYVKSVYVTTESGNFTFNNVTDTPAITLSTTTSNNVCFYKSPFYCDDSETNYANMLCKSGIKESHLSDAYSLKKLAVSTNGKWIKVEFVGTVTISSNNAATYTEANPGIFYIQSLAFSRGDIVDEGWSDNSTPGGDGFFS